MNERPATGWTSPRDGKSPAQNSKRHRQDDSHNRGANISANESQNNEESFSAPGLDESNAVLASVEI